MKTMHLNAFGRDNLVLVDAPEPAKPAAGEVLIKCAAASLNPRDSQIIEGRFSPNVEFPLIPLSDGAGEVLAIGEGVTRVAPGDLVTSLFFPNWISGEALDNERAVSSGLEAPGVLRELALYPEDALVKAADHLTAAEAACFPCAGLTAWTSLVDKSGIGAGDHVLIQGTGGVATAALQLTKALGARAIVISSSDARLERATALGADHVINYSTEPNWGPVAHELSAHGVDAVIEIGGTGTMENSLAAIRHGGHINIIGYMAGVDMGITVFPLIIKNANLHGIGTGNRDSFEAMMQLVGDTGLRPVIERAYPMEQIVQALDDLDAGGFVGKLVLDLS
ncbi:MAG: NAD(P)-dependent alcohol dehydrogenase [Pseudomonadota bacterium]